MEQFEHVTLSTLGNGALLELFEREMLKVMKNIGDENTKPTAKREITLKITFTPYKDRRGAEVSLNAQSKLVTAQSVDGRLFLAMQDGQLHAFPHDVTQTRLFPGGGPSSDEKPVKILPLAKTS